MNNKYLIGVIIVLAGLCVYFFINSNNVTQTTGIQSSNDKVLSEETETTDNFSRNQACLEDKDRLTVKFKSETSDLGESSIEQIFYSPKLNTCVYVKRTEKDFNYFRSLYDVRNDSPNSKPLENCDSISPFATEVKDFYLKQDGNLDEWNKLVSACDSFDSKLEEYKTQI